jgi:hypothetical protein
VFSVTFSRIRIVGIDVVLFQLFLFRFTATPILLFFAKLRLFPVLLPLKPPSSPLEHGARALLLFEVFFIGTGKGSEIRFLGYVPARTKGSRRHSFLNALSVFCLSASFGGSFLRAISFSGQAA